MSVPAVGVRTEHLHVGGEPEFGDQGGHVDLAGGDPQPAEQRAESAPGEFRAQVVTLALPRLRQRETEQGPGAVPLPVHGTGLPHPPLTVEQHLRGVLGEAEVHTAALALAAEQAPVDHAGQRRAGRLLAHAGAGENVDHAARVHAHVASEHLLAQEGEHQGLRSQRLFGGHAATVPPVGFGPDTHRAGRNRLSHPAWPRAPAQPSHGARRRGSADRGPLGPSRPRYPSAPVQRPTTSTKTGLA